MPLKSAMFGVLKNRLELFIPYCSMYASFNVQFKFNVSFGRKYFVPGETPKNKKNKIIILTKNKKNKTETLTSRVCIGC